MSVSSRQITQATVFRVLIAGFLLVILLLLAAGFISVQNIRYIKENVADLVGEELVATRLLDDVQQEQAALTAVFYKLSRDPEQVDREKVLSQLDDADRRLEEIGQSVAGTPEEPLWNELKQASSAFSAEARRLLALDSPSTLLSRDLFRRHEEAASIVAKLVAASYRNASAAKEQIDRRSAELIWNSAVLLGGSLLLAVLCALLTVRLTISLLKRMEWQASELSRVSWHMLENQETTARRFSHELHDELGQSLMALKANLLALKTQSGVDAGRLDDCAALVDGAIQNVRELSQLLHPTILDDFGLDAGLRWLTEGFMQRTGIEVDYVSDFTGRLPEETETHLFRICQEALTNVARHSGATRVRAELRAEPGKVRLSIQDNGRGLPADGKAFLRGLGLIGMRARARSAGGELTFRSVEGSGLLIDAAVPRRALDEEKNPDLVSR